MDKDAALTLALAFIEKVNMEGWVLADFEQEMYAVIAAIKKALGWQGLTDDELMEILGYGKIERSPTRGFDFVDVIDVKLLTRSLINAIEAKLKEKNT